MIFETKKVPIETLGEYLAEIRSNSGLSVAEVVEKTGVAEKYLLNLEAGQYHHLPPDVYVLGFLKKLADFYAIPAETLLSQYDKERGIIDQVAKKLTTPITTWRSWTSKLVVTPKLITLASGIGLVCIAVVYLVVSVSLINKTPSLKIFEPAPGSIVKDSVISLSGQTDSGSTVAINGQNLFVDPQGNFHTTLGAVTGQKQLTVTSQNKFGKQSTQNLLVMVESPPLALTTAAGQDSQAKGLSLELKFARPTTIDVNRDGVDLAKETVPADGVKTILADNKIILKTMDAGSISAILNGKDLGVLGRTKEPLTIPFTP